MSVNYNTVEGTTLFNSYSDSDWSTFASDCATNWIAAWGSRFNLTAKQAAEIASVDSTHRTVFIIGANKVSSELAAGRKVDVGMRIFDPTPSDPFSMNHYTVHYNFYATVTAGGIVGYVSCWVTHTR